MIHLLKRAAIGCALALGLISAAPALADCTTATTPNTVGTTANATYEATKKTCEAVSGVSGLAASGVTAVTGTLATNTISATFAPIAGRTYYVTLSGTGSATVMVIYSRDAGATWAPEATGVDGSAPIVMNKIAYAGLPVRVPLSVSESGVLTALCPGTMSSGTACAGTVTGTVPFGFTQ
jgi:hypothetical protein